MIETIVSNLKVELLSSEDSYEFYKKAYVELESSNPYYSLELFKNTGEEQGLYCFYYYVNDRLHGFMPFNLRNIVINNSDTGYFDVTSPYGYNGPLFKKGISKNLKEKFWTTVDNWYEKNKVISEFVRFNFMKNYEEYTGTAMHTLKNVKGDISCVDTFWSNLKSSTRNQFRKAEKSGLKFEIHFKNIPLEKIEHFHGLYIGTMDRREATEAFYHKLSYFTEFCQKNTNQVAIGLVYFDGVPISGEYFLKSKDTIFSYLGGTDANYFKLRPNEFLKIKAIKWASELGLNYYLIGGGQSDGDNLYLYKKKYFPNDDDVSFFTGRKVINEEVYSELIGVPEDSEIDFLNLEEGFFPKYREE